MKYIGANTHTVVNVKEEDWSGILPLTGWHFVYIWGLKDQYIQGVLQLSTQEKPNEEKRVCTILVIAFK